MKALDFMVRVRSPAKYHRAKSILKVLVFIALSMFMIINIILAHNLWKKVGRLEAEAHTEKVLYATKFAPYYIDGPPLNMSLRAHEQGHKKDLKTIEY
ncbi:hypothetical protein [Sporolactobacillus sp. KGMB 08714]|uniref:hypothetical protein n=1 Tax=Sporolactobacillus sp. KGMB 08714 TaxID=3064704 RepID=UPI002FBF0930